MDVVSGSTSFRRPDVPWTDQSEALRALAGQASPPASGSGVAANGSTGERHRDAGAVECVARDDDLDDRSLPDARRHPILGSDLVRARPHSGQAEVALGNGRGIEALAVVADPEDDVRAAALEGDVDL